jgi:hypothetical protein
MSDQSQGPGWWQASDGKWYPPEQAPAATPPATEQLGGPAIPPAVPPVGPTPMYAPAAAGGGGSNTGKIVAIVIVLALIAGGVAFALTRDSGGGGSVKAFCDTAKKFQNDDSLNNNAFDDPAKIDKAVAAFDQLTKAAPKEIKADMQTVQAVFKKFADAVKSAGNDPSKQFAAILAASAGVDRDKVNQAEKNIDAFGKKNCGSDFSFSSSSDEFSFPSDSSSSESSFGTDSFSFNESSFSSLLSSFSSDFGSDFFSSLDSQFSTSS